ncbi:DUF3299 domain-containing protein [Pseudooceanicola sp. HF7]|uniref:DUF3299 domain-containing protein n=1 Tax=Pseudooceanicola sp. HF7 TaxID=2721560 RepID=UPI0014304EB7|nr:DUF3299 domain-containing protein [Pseudooceanicola sp. HF7]NIZ11117.1 DUF3299 domain-containing protein [Pseudooceanicola sp. HF7]
MTASLKRRAFCAGTALLAALPASVLRAESTTVLTWKDLLPEGETTLPPSLQGMVQHDQAPLASQQPESSGVRTDWNGETVQLSGFVVPLDYEGTAITAFMLVPYVGACIHVPPPPANQLVLVTSAKPYESRGLFEAVTVTGMFGTAATATQLADVGYALSADRVTPYRG